eukprot:Rhum_TRINITY_DN14326_c11_g1::Rhum_TRINITY_DN14326_c11_g1_i1::g.85045::m.85045
MRGSQQRSPRRVDTLCFFFVFNSFGSLSLFFFLTREKKKTPIKSGEGKRRREGAENAEKQGKKKQAALDRATHRAERVGVSAAHGRERVCRPRLVLRGRRGRLRAGRRRQRGRCVVGVETRKGVRSQRIQARHRRCRCTRGCSRRAERDRSERVHGQKGREPAVADAVHSRRRRLQRARQRVVRRAGLDRKRVESGTRGVRGAGVVVVAAVARRELLAHRRPCAAGADNGSLVRHLLVVRHLRRRQHSRRRDVLPVLTRLEEPVVLVRLRARRLRPVSTGALPSLPEAAQKQQQQQHQHGTSHPEDDPLHGPVVVRVGRRGAALESVRHALHGLPAAPAAEPAQRLRVVLVAAHLSGAQRRQPQPLADAHRGTGARVRAARGRLDQRTPRRGGRLAGKVHLRLRRRSRARYHLLKRHPHQRRVHAQRVGDERRVRPLDVRDARHRRAPVQRRPQHLQRHRVRRAGHRRTRRWPQRRRPRQRSAARAHPVAGVALVRRVVHAVLPALGAQRHRGTLVLHLQHLRLERRCRKERLLERAAGSLKDVCAQEILQRLRRRRPEHVGVHADEGHLRRPRRSALRHRQPLQRPLRQPQHLRQRAQQVEPLALRLLARHRQRHLHAHVRRHQRAALAHAGRALVAGRLREAVVTERAVGAEDSGAGAGDRVAEPLGVALRGWRARDGRAAGHTLALACKTDVEVRRCVAVVARLVQHGDAVGARATQAHAGLQAGVRRPVDARVVAAHGRAGVDAGAHACGADVARCPRVEVVARRAVRLVRLDAAVAGPARHRATPGVCRGADAGPALQAARAESAAAHVVRGEGVPVVARLEAEGRVGAQARHGVAGAGAVAGVAGVADDAEAPALADALALCALVVHRQVVVVAAHAAVRPQRRRALPGARVALARLVALAARPAHDSLAQVDAHASPRLAVVVLRRRVAVVARHARVEVAHLAHRRRAVALAVRLGALRVEGRAAAAAADGVDHAAAVLAGSLEVGARGAAGHRRCRAQPRRRRARAAVVARSEGRTGLVRTLVDADAPSVQARIAARREVVVVARRAVGLLRVRAASGECGRVADAGPVALVRRETRHRRTGRRAGARARLAGVGEGGRVAVVAGRVVCQQRFAAVVRGRARKTRTGVERLVRARHLDRVAAGERPLALAAVAAVFDRVGVAVVARGPVQLDGPDALAR